MSNWDTHGPAKSDFLEEKQAEIDPVDVTDAAYLKQDAKKHRQYLKMQCLGYALSLKINQECSNQRGLTSDEVLIEVIKNGS